jgi:hypothetical protein
MVWSSPLAGNGQRAMRYIDLMGGQKPHLLVRTRNNLGAETFVQYAPSTKFYIADKLAGTPWIIRLPFPVHVVERVESYDYVSRNRFVTRYAYHHGYYDGVEREFRGFGRVDQWDTEELATLSNSSSFPQTTNQDPVSNVPPSLTKTWFHTGGFFGEAVISKQFEHEYYAEGDSIEAVAGLSPDQLELMLLDDTVLPTDILLADNTRVSYNLSGEEMREACRALRGSVLRQEVYGLDGTDESDRPYSVSERNYTIETLQPQRPNKFGVFFAHPRETIDFYYERKLYKVVGSTLADQSNPPSNTTTAADPRVTHAVTLEVDPFGNALQSAAIGYGRRYADPALTPDDQTKQTSLLATYAENSYTNAILADDDYRVPLPAESSSYELVQVQPDANQPGLTNLFRFDELQAKVNSASDRAHEIPYETLNPTGLTPAQPYRRLLDSTGAYYRPDDMGAAAGNPNALLPLGTLESHALPGTSYKLAFTPGLVSQAYQRGGTPLLPTPANVLGSASSDGGGYIDLNGDGHWWIPSGRTFYSPNPADTAAQEISNAQANFFLARRLQDPFGNSSTVLYDSYNLLIVEAEDALQKWGADGKKVSDGNKVTVGERSADGTITNKNDYRVLAPALLTDPNRNRAAVSFDALGMVAGTALMGKTTENLGDTLADFTADLARSQIARARVNCLRGLAGSCRMIPTG